MTCKQCKFEFCWLCLGDYKKHSSETGIGLCNSIKDVEKIGRNKDEKQNEALRAEFELKKLEHYSQRFIAHQNSVKFAAEKVEQIKKEISEIAASQQKYDVSQFDFLVDIAELVK